MTRERDWAAFCLSTTIGTIETAARTKICTQMTNPNSIGLPSSFVEGMGYTEILLFRWRELGNFLISAER